MLTATALLLPRLVAQRCHRGELTSTPPPPPMLPRSIHKSHPDGPEGDSAPVFCEDAYSNTKGSNRSYTYVQEKTSIKLQELEL